MYTALFYGLNFIRVIQNWLVGLKFNTEEKAKKYSLNPVDMVIFGGVLNFGKMVFLARKTVGQLWRKFEEVGFGKKEGIYDTRDWKTIQNWTKELAKKFQS